MALVATHLILLVSLLGYFLVYSQLINNRRINDVVQNRIDKFIRNIYLPSISASGCGLAIVKDDGQLLYTTGYGFADHHRKISNGNHTQFLLASTSKSIAAVVVVKTLNEYFPELDEAVLDTPIKSLMPQVNFTLNDRVRTEQTAFRDLLSHKMCIRRDDFSVLTEPFDSTAEIVYRQRYTQESCGFRSQFVYNNHMVLLASYLIEQLVKENFVDYTERFLKQLGMHDAAYIRQTDDFSKIENRAMPYYINDSIRYQTNPDLVKRIVWTQAVGGLYVSPDDMIRFMRFQINMGELDGTQFVPKNVMSWLTKPSNVIKNMQFRKSDQDGAVDSFLAYGLGLMIGTYDGWECISHNGVYYPYRSEMSWYPELKLGIFSSTHETPNMGTGAVLHKFIFEALNGNEKAEELAVKKIKQEMNELKQKVDRNNKLLFNFLEKYRNETASRIDDSFILGSYGHPVSGMVDVFPKLNPHTRKSELYLSHGKWAKGWMERFGSLIEENDNTILYKTHWDTDIFQDNYAMGVDNFFRFVTITKSGIFSFMIASDEYNMIPITSFKKGAEARIEYLDPIPWRSEKCE